MGGISEGVVTDLIVQGAMQADQQYQEEDRPPGHHVSECRQGALGEMTERFWFVVSGGRTTVVVGLVTW